ncbi:MAG: EamA family transporter, partial [Pseudomonadota bacterium]
MTRSAMDTAQGDVRPGWLIAAPMFFLLFWSGGFVFAKLGLQHAEPLTFLTLRFAIVVAAMA